MNFTVGGSTLKSCGLGGVELSVGTTFPIAVEVLIVNGKLLGIDLLLGLGAIKLLRVMSLTSTGKVKFPRCDEPTCAAITINEPNFSAEYDKTYEFSTDSTIALYLVLVHFDNSL